MSRYENPRYVPVDERKIFLRRRAPDGTEFKIQKTGLNWTLYVKERGKARWDKIQSAANALFLRQVLDNQREFRRLRRSGL